MLKLGEIFRLAEFVFLGLAERCEDSFEEDVKRHC